jgi:hypothetical protein
MILYYLNNILPEHSEITLNDSFQKRLGNRTDLYTKCKYLVKLEIKYYLTFQNIILYIERTLNLQNSQFL